MTAERPSPAVLEDWIAKSWDRRPPFTYEALVAMWREEQAARAEAHEKDYRARQLDELRQRVAALERVLGPHGKSLIGDIAEGFGAVLGKARAAERERILAEVDKRFEERAPLSYAGVWSEGVAYRKGSMVTHAGSAWIALAGVEPGAKPGRAPEWRLAVKSAESKGTVVV
jgi:hypothetical protein